MRSPVNKSTSLLYGPIWIVFFFVTCCVLLCFNNYCVCAGFQLFSVRHWHASTNEMFELMKYLQIQWVEEQNHVFSLVLVQADLLELTVDNGGTGKMWGWLLNGWHFCRCFVYCLFSIFKPGWRYDRGPMKRRAKNRWEKEQKLANLFVILLKSFREIISTFLQKLKHTIEMRRRRQRWGRERGRKRVVTDSGREK